MDKVNYEYTVVGTKSIQGMLQAISDYETNGWDTVNFSAVWKTMAPPIGETIFYILFKREAKPEIVKK